MTRDEAAVAHMQAMQAEANAFAMELLMPEDWLRRDLGPEGIDIEDARRIKALAKKYRVSEAVMVLRIGQLSARIS